MTDWAEAGRKSWETRRKREAMAIMNSKTFLEDLKEVQANRLHKTYVRKLERHIGNTESYKEKLYTDIAERISTIKVINTNLNATETRKYLESRTGIEQKSDVRRSVCTIWSDHHLGTNVDYSEMAGSNMYNWEIAARRLGMICEETATYKQGRRKYHDELVIFLLGDIIGGIIHNQEGTNYDLMINQIIGATQYYIQAISYLKARGLYPKIRVFCQPGNHGRTQHKQDKGRAFVNKYDSLENIIYYNLCIAFKSDPQIDIIIPKAPFCDVDVQGHRIFGTHGDTLFLTGNVGATINNRAIEQRVATINEVERLRKKKAYSLFLAAHVHHPAITTTSSGVKIVVNGCLIGNDTYGQGLGIAATVPSQHIWETTPDYVFGDNRFLEVKSADTEKEFEKIIFPYKGEIE
jgi:hypothetical protein